MLLGAVGKLALFGVAAVAVFNPVFALLCLVAATLKVGVLMILCECGRILSGYEGLAFEICGDENAA